MLHKYATKRTSDIFKCSHSHTTTLDTDIHTWTHTHTLCLLIGIGCYVADNHRHFICIKHRGDAPFPRSAPREDDWQRLVRSQTLKCDSAITEFKGAAGPDSSEGYKAPLNFTFCLDPILLTDISECAISDASLMDAS